MTSVIMNCRESQSSQVFNATMDRHFLMFDDPFLADRAELKLKLNNKDESMDLKFLNYTFIGCNVSESKYHCNSVAISIHKAY